MGVGTSASSGKAALLRSEISPPKSATHGRKPRATSEPLGTWASPWEVLIARDLGRLQNLCYIKGHGVQLSEPTLPGTRQFQNCHHHGEPGGGAVGQRNPASLSRRQVSGPWSGVPAAVSPCRAPTSTAHRAGAQGRSTKAGQVVPLKKSTQTKKRLKPQPERVQRVGAPRVCTAAPQRGGGRFGNRTA